jgi:tRNA-specific 2-thiouridylase
VLYDLTQDQLAHTVFPLGEMRKEEVRKIAGEQGFVNAHKKDSQDICFVPDGDYAAAIARFTGKDYPHGEFVDREGRVMGEHRGIIRYTIGQRKGLGLALKEPAYVLKKDDLERALIVLQKALEAYPGREES